MLNIRTRMAHVLRTISKITLRSALSLFYVFCFLLIIWGSIYFIVWFSGVIGPVASATTVVIIATIFLMLI